MKRCIDLGVGGLLLIVTAPILLAAMAAVRLSSPGPVIFRQQRVGRHGRLFHILKLRTMRSDASPAREITVGQDGRITPIGAVLRRWKIDELPQLINVLRGDMSMVGPRPDLPSYVARYPDKLRRAIQTVRPGITDRASIKYRHENDLLAAQIDPDRYYLDVILPDKLDMAAAYAEKAGAAEDFRIVMATLRSLIRSR